MKDGIKIQLVFNILKSIQQYSELFKKYIFYRLLLLLLLCPFLTSEDLEILMH